MIRSSVLHDSEDFMSLSSLSSRLECLEGKEQRGSEAQIELLHSAITTALELLSNYDSAENEDEKHDFGFDYSIAMADIEEIIEDINENGINLYLH